MCTKLEGVQVEEQECDGQPGLGAQLRSLDCALQVMAVLEECFGGQGARPEVCFRCSSLEVVVLSTPEAGKLVWRLLHSSRTEMASPKQKGWDVGKNKGGIRLSDLAKRINGWWRWGL